MESGISTLEFIRDGKLIVVTLSNDVKINYIIGSWVKSKGKIDEGIFTIFNNFVNRFDNEKRLLLDRFYVDCYNLLNELKINIRELDTSLYYLNELYFSLFNWGELREYVILNANMTPSIKTEVEPEYGEEMTYLTDHYIDLLTFSIMIKGLMPIWGLYYTVTESQLAASTSSVVKNEHVFMSALEIMKVPAVLSNPAYVKMELYITAFLSNKDVNGFTIINDISSEDTDNYILAIALWKKIILFSGLGIHGIVRNLAHICKEKTKGMMLNKPKEKKDKSTKQNTDDDKNNTIGDTFRMTTTLPPELLTGTEFYISKQFTKLPGYKRVFNLINGVLIKRVYTTTILSIIYKDKIHINLLECIEYDKLLTLIAHAHLLLINNPKFLTIAQILISNGRDKDVRVYDMGLKGTTPIGKEQLLLLGTVYNAGLISMAIAGINSIAKEVMLHDWDFDISKLKIELVELINEYNN